MEIKKKVSLLKRINKFIQDLNLDTIDKIFIVIMASFLSLFLFFYWFVTYIGVRL